MKKNLKVINPNLPINKVDDKSKTTDVLLSVEGNIINLEMNSNYYEGLFERNDIYYQTLSSRIPKRGEAYSDYKQTIQINIDAFDRFIKPISIFRVLEIDTHEMENIGYLKFHINLFKIKKKYYNGEKLSYLEKLALLIAIDNAKDLESISKGDIAMEEYKDKVEDLNYDEIFGDLVSAEWKAKDNEMVERTIRYNAEKKGMEKGMKKGMKKGMEDMKISIIRNMLSNNMDIKTISKVTGISEAEIKDISV